LSSVALVQIILDYLDETIGFTFPERRRNGDWNQCYWVGTPYHLMFSYDEEGTVVSLIELNQPPTCHLRQLYPCSLSNHYLHLLRQRYQLDEQLHQRRPPILTTIEQYWRIYVKQRQQQWLQRDEEWELQHEQNVGSESELTDDDDDEMISTKESKETKKPRPHWQRPLDRFQDDQDYYASAFSLQDEEEDDDEVMEKIGDATGII
jgi:hypothetical protein